MKISLSSEDLKIGMYVNLGKRENPASILEDEFLIKSEIQIENIIAQGILTVLVDTDKSDGDVIFAPEDERGAAPPDDFDPMTNISNELKDTIEDMGLAPEKKAAAVYNHTIKMMNTILEDPNKENILAGKMMIADTVDLIVGDDETADCLTQITSHDYYTYTHSVNVGMYGILIAKAVYKNLPAENMHELGAGFFLHDLGKCDVPAQLINKPGPLSDKEWEQMRMHPTYGQKILRDHNLLSHECANIVYQHHEREDGTGYPTGAHSHHIHDYARICAIADVYDALTSTRAYKKKLSSFDALRIMKNEMLNHFNKDLFREFVMLFTK